MLELTIQLGEEGFDEVKNEFVPSTHNIVLELEHSLVSLSKWESKFEKPFLGKTEKTSEEVLAYIKAMIITPDYPPEVLDRLSQQNIDEINKYIELKMTATTVNEPRSNNARPEIITSELIYFWMTSYQIPWEVQYWHLNRLLTLIRVFGAKNQDSKPRRSTPQDLHQRQLLNEQRKRQYGTSG